MAKKHQKKKKASKLISNNSKTTSKIGKNEIYAYLSKISTKPASYSIKQIEEYLMQKAGAKSLIEYIDLTNKSREFDSYSDTYDIIAKAMKNCGYESNVANTFYFKRQK